MSDTFLIRDVYGPNIVRKIAEDIKGEYGAFEKEKFLDAILPNIEAQTYSERKESITNALVEYLPKDFSKSIQILLKITPSPYKEGIDSDTLGRFYVSTFTAYISQLGIEHYELSMSALHTMTKSFSAEWDIRPFLLKYPEKTLSLLKKWTKDKNQHVRRLVSEGSRPNLPWGKKLKFIDQNPKGTTLPLLELLQDDPEEYVRRSVANHLNDLSKTNGDLVVDVLKKWQKQNYTKDKERMINHALRTLIKRGHRGALAMIGYDDDIDLSVELLSLNNHVNWQGKMTFEFKVKNNKDTSQKLLVDFIIGFQKKDGQMADKVFKLKKLELAPQEEVQIKKSFSFQPITTRVYYPGEHRLALQINGKEVYQAPFVLLKS